MGERKGNIMKRETDGGKYREVNVGEISAKTDEK